MLRSIAAIGIAIAAASAHGIAAPVDPSSIGCVHAWPEARYRALGYNHIVHVRNQCDARAECAVSTNVNPAPENVTVPGHKEVEVTTFLGSPAREFTPKVECRMVP
jgi:hypothetical protein